MIVKKLIRKLIYPETYSSEAFIMTLRNKYKIDIGENCIIYSPNSVVIDKNRPHMLHIGNDVRITKNVTILCHDYSRSVFCDMEDGYGNVGEAAMTSIGNNVFIGMNAVILMGANIGSNSIVGAGAVVSGCFPDGVVIAGNPGKVICTVEELYEKRKKKEIDSAILYASAWNDTYGRWPTVIEMTNAFSWLYLPHTQDTVEKYPKLFQLNGINKDRYVEKFLNSEPIFESYDKFIEECQRMKK